MTSTARRDPATDEEFLAQLYKGGELLAAGKVNEAKDHLERAYQLHPKNEKAQNLLGLSYFKLGLFERASEIYELLVNDNPADPTLRVNLGLVYLKARSSSASTSIAPPRRQWPRPSTPPGSSTASSQSRRRRSARSASSSPR